MGKCHGCGLGRPIGRYRVVMGRFQRAQKPCGWIKTFALCGVCLKQINEMMSAREKKAKQPAG